jgi:hypothetical protein
MCQKGAKIVDTLFLKSFGHTPKQMDICAADEAKCASLMLHCYLEGVKACLTSPDQYFEIESTIKTIFK